MKILFFVLALYLLPGLFSFSQTTNSPLSIGTPESAAMSSERLQRIDKLVTEYVTQKRIAGAIALVIRNNKIVYYKGIGYNDIDSRSPLKKDAICRVASQTKAITSTAVMMLFEEGKFLLDDPISRYIPAFGNPVVLSTFNEVDSSYTTVPAKREITIRDLLTHLSGIDYPVIGTQKMVAIYAKAGIPSGISGGDRLLATEMKKLAALPLVHQPGDGFTYGLSVDVLGYLVEVESGMSLDRFFRERIFEPLGMNDTYFYLPPDKRNRLAILYTEDSLHHLIKRPAHFNGFAADYPNLPGSYYSGGAGLSSTALDYAIFLQMILNGGQYRGTRILSRNTVRMMTMNQIGDFSRGEEKFGLGFEVITQNGSSRMPNNEGSFDWGGFFNTSYWADPKEKLVGLFLMQVAPSGASELADKFKVLVYQAISD